MLFVVSEQGTVAPAAIFPILRRLQRSHLDLPGGKVNQVSRSAGEWTDKKFPQRVYDWSVFPTGQVAATHSAGPTY
jgi:hypothetical protein